MIYVDPLLEYPDKPYGHRYWCHMMTDSTDLTELHKMATKLGLRRYFQNKPTHPHYDLTPSKRKEAIRLGAQSITTVEMLQKCRIKPITSLEDTTGV